MIGHFYYAPFRDGMLMTNDTGRYAFLSQEEFKMFINEDDRLDSEFRDILDEDGFCFSDSVEGYIRRNKDAVRDANSYLLTGTSLFILAVTNACNYRCVYCQANGMSEVHHMSREVAEQALQRIKDAPSSDITIEFQGGEPLLNYDVIRYIVLRGQELLCNKKVQYTVVSNLSLLTEEMTDFFKENKVTVSTSIDGPEELHDYNRPEVGGKGSFRDTLRGIEMLKAKGIVPGAIQTSTARSLDYANEIVDEYVRLGFGQVFLRPLTRLGAAARRWDQVGYDADQFLAFYRKALDRVLEYNLKGVPVKEYHASLFLSKILFGQALNYMELRSPCGAGIGQVAITANGNVYTCDEGRMMAEAGDEAFCLGNVFDHDYDDWIHSSCCEAICSASLLDTLPGCCDCVYKPYCGVCPVVNYAIYGNIMHVSSERCKIYKGILDILFGFIKDRDEKIVKILENWGRQA